MKRKLLFLFFFYVFVAYSQQKKDGDITINQENVCLNRYTRVVSDVSAGSNQVTVEDISQLNDDYHSFLSDDDPLTTGVDETRRFQENTFNSNNLESGDLVLLYQAQGALINTTDTWDYGKVTDYNNSGTYEFAYVLEVNGNTITLSCELENSFFAANYTQLIRVPQYNNMIVNVGASVAANQWGSPNFGGSGPSAVERRKGGIVVFLADNLENNGRIHADFSGFRGGSIEDDNYSYFNSGSFFTTFRQKDLTSANEGKKTGAEKGESIAGYRNDYDDLEGRYGRGAPANGGGGGNSHNAGGGGGANGGIPADWFRGSGVMNDFSGDSGTCGNPGAWALDPEYIAYGGLTNSSGGGRGGYSYSTDLDGPCFNGPSYPKDYISPGNPPNNFFSSWSGDRRKAVGGLGGHPVVTQSYDYQIFFGGGGGAGDGNNNANSDGGDGGGIVLLTIKNVITGNGEISATGQDGYRTNVGSNGNDAPGGGGGGGTILIQAQNISNSTFINASGGKGGNQYINHSSEAEGPGGGGGGGVISISASSDLSTKSVSGGQNGISDSNAVKDEFRANGATSGNLGTITTVSINFDQLVCTLDIDTQKSYNVIDFDGNGLDVGDMLEYTITITNNSDVVINDIKLKDLFLDNNGNPLLFYYSPGDTYSSDYSNAEVTDDIVDIASIAIDEVITFNMYYEITQSDIDAGGIQNKITVEGESSGGYDVSDDSDDTDDTDGNSVDDPTETTFNQNPSIESEKTYTITDNGDGVIGVNDVINYSVVIVNTGDVTLTNVDLTDTLTDFENTHIPLSLTYNTSTMGSSEGELKVGEMATYNATHTITQADFDSGSLNNSVFVTGTSPKNVTVEDTSDDGDDLDGNTVDDPTETIFSQNPSIEAVKTYTITDDGDGLIGVNDVINYTVVVENTGDVTLTNIDLTDTLTDFENVNTTLSLTYVSSTMGSSEGELKVGEEATYNVSYTIAQASFDSGGLNNSVFVTGTSPKNVTVEDTSDDGDDLDGNTEDDPTLVVMNQVPFDCPQAFFQVIVDQLFQLDPVTGQYNPVGPAVSFRYNAMAYNEADDFLYAVVREADPTDKDSYNTLVKNNDIVRIDKNGKAKLYNSITSSSFNYLNAADIANNILYARSGTNNNVYKLDLSSPTATPIQIANNFGGADLSIINNVAYGMGGNSLYKLENLSSLDGSSIISTTQTPISQCDGNAIPSVKGYGASFVENTDKLYFSYNGELGGNGELFYIVDYDTSSPCALKLINTEQTSQNDGASCPSAIVFQSDFGDAPDLAQGTATGDYKTHSTDNGAEHVQFNTGLYLGSTVDYELEASPNNSATGDSDDAVTIGSVALQDYLLFKGNTYNLDIPVNKDASIEKAFLSIWIDFNRNGNFEDSNEKVQDAVEITADGLTNLSLPLDIPNTALKGETFIRVRLSSSESMESINVALDGEVEDYRVNIIEPSIEITKTVQISGTKLGDVIVYDLTIENTGNIDLTDVEVQDPNADSGTLIIPSSLDSDNDLDIDVLNAGQIVTVSISQTITQEHLDAGEILNQATIIGEDTNGENVSDVSDDGDDTDGNTEDDPTITKLIQDPSIEVIKTVTSDVSNLAVGDVVTYTVLVSNTGNVTLDNVSIVDTLTELDGTSNPQTLASIFDSSSMGSLEGILQVGEVTTYTVSYTVTQSDIDNGGFANSVFASGDSPEDTKVNDTSDDNDDADGNTEDDPTEVTISEDPSIEVIKTVTSDVSNLAVGNIVTYTVLVTNTGNVTLDNVSIVDTLTELDGVTNPQTLASIFDSSSMGSLEGILQVGEVATYTVSYTVTQSDIDNGGFANSVFASGDSPEDTTVEDVSDDNDDADGNTEDDPTEVTISEDPSIEVIKTVTNDVSNLAVGSEVTYTVLVSNTGNVTLDDVSIVDTLTELDGVTNPQTLASIFDSSSMGSLEGILQVGEVATYTVSYTVTQSDIDNGGFANSVFASGDSPEDTTVEDVSDDNDDTDGNTEDDPTEVIISEDPSIEVIKTVTSDVSN
uniref:DUF7507 domain-containing protein n=1 Tax=Aureivirga sp. CE67 TaxID=1788983 RepID=UPI0018CA29E9